MSNADGVRLCWKAKRAPAARPKWRRARTSCRATSERYVCNDYEGGPRSIGPGAVCMSGITRAIAVDQAHRGDNPTRSRQLFSEPYCWRRPRLLRSGAQAAVCCASTMIDRADDRVEALCCGAASDFRSRFTTGTISRNHSRCGIDSTGTRDSPTRCAALPYHYVDIRATGGRRIMVRIACAARSVRSDSRHGGGQTEGGVRRCRASRRRLGWAAAAVGLDIALA